jgi:peroxiredoxin
MPTKKYLKYTAYAATFLAGMWGGNLIIKQLSNNSEGQQTAQVMVGKTAPPFQLPDIDKVVRHSDRWAGKVMVVNFWATWCPPCRSETPLFVELQEKYADAGLQFVGIAIDTPDKVRDFMDTYGVNYPMLVGEDDAIEIAKDYGNRFGALPYTVVVDRDSKIRFVQRGELTREAAEQAIARLL